MTKRNPARSMDEPDGVADARKSFGGKELTTLWRDDAASMESRCLSKVHAPRMRASSDGRATCPQMRRMFRHFAALAIALGAPDARRGTGLEPFIRETRMAPRD